MDRRVPRLVIAVYVLLGAFGVHHARYALAPGAEAPASHGYLDGAPPLLAGLVALALARFAVAALDRRAAAGRRLGPGARWLLATAAFLALYTLQESGEALVATGHLAGPAALLADGGWTVLPLAAGAGAVLAALLRGTEAVLTRLAVAIDTRRRIAAARLPAGAVAAPPTHRLWTPRAPGLARHVAGRAPPAAT